MSVCLSPYQKLKFEQSVSHGEHSPKFINRSDVDESMVELSFTVNNVFLKELGDAKDQYCSLSYVSILNTQLQSLQLVEGDRIESRLSTCVSRAFRKLKKATGGRQRNSVCSEKVRIAIFRGELVDVSNLNCQIISLNKDLIDLEHRCEILLRQIQEFKTSHTNDTESSLENIKRENSKLYEYIRKLETGITENSGKTVDGLKGKQLRKTVKTLSTYAEKALWFAESYGLIPEIVKCKTTSGETCNLVLNNFSDIKETEKGQVRQLVHLLDKFRVSDNAYHELSLIFEDIPRKYLVVQDRNNLNCLFHIERTPGNSPGAYMSLKTELQRILSKQETLNESYCVKVSGDGTRAGRSANLVVISFSLLKTNEPCSVNDVNVIGVVKIEESYKNLRDTCIPIFDEIFDISEKGEIDVGEKSVSIDIVCGGDMKFLQLLSGLSGSISNHPCPWCKCHKNDRHDTSKCWNFFHSSSQKRTFAENQSYLSSNKFSMKNPPLLKLDPEHFVPDELHLFMRIGDILLRNLIDDAKDKDDEAKVAGKPATYVTSLVEKIRQCGVRFNFWNKKENNELNWSSLSGVEMKKLLEFLPDKLFFVIHDDTHDTTVQLLRSFTRLHTFLCSPLASVKEPESIFTQCKEWLDLFLSLGAFRKGYQKGNVTPYMHVLVYHVPFFISKYGAMNSFSGQSVEKINDEMKKIYHGKCANRDVAVEALTVRKRIEFGSENLAREKRKYTKTNQEYWENEIHCARQAKKQNIIKEQELANQKFQKTRETEKEMTVEEIRLDLKVLGVKTRLKSKEKLVDLLKRSR